MPTSRLGSRYTRWDGTQQIDGLTADDVMRAMSDDLMQDGDLNRALQRLFRWGFEKQDGDHVPGLREMMERLRERRQEQLSRYDLGSMMDQIREKLDEIVDTERQGIARKLDDAGLTKPGDRDADLDYPDRPAPGGQSGRAPEEGATTQAPGSADRQRSEAQESAGDRSDAESTRPGAESGGAESGTENQALRRMLEQMAEKHLDQLDAVPEDPAGAIKSLTDYDFMTPEARQAFNELLAMLQEQVLQQSFQGMQQALSEMTPEDVQQTRQMMSELNDMLESQQRGEDPQFEQFMHRWGHFFGPDVNSLDDLMKHLQQRMGAMQQLMQSMSAEQRDQLQGMMQAVLQDDGVKQEMSRLGQNLGQMMPPEEWRKSFQFSGDESLTLAEAMRMMERLNDYDELEEELRGVRDWEDLANLDDERLQDLLGAQEQEQIDQLQQLARLLEDAGYVRKTRRGYELTPQGVRRIGEKALTDIFADLKRDRMGQHDLRREGGSGDRTDVTKPYEWGDPFLLDIPKTIMNAVQRGDERQTRGIQLEPRDFEVYRTEYATRVSTVLMVDMSRSMLYNGCFNAAKKVALALDSLIRGKYPRDDLSIIGFSYMAQEIKPVDLPSLDWNEYNYGTNMQHGFQLARQLLGRQKGSNRQIIVITDGEPTAHLDQGHVRFSYPPTPRTFQETLKEVVRCTRDGITINTFMLERSPYMVQFVNDLMRINGGRVFVATPDRLGEYILVDYVAHKQKWIG